MKKRYIYLDILKIISIVLVIFNHSHMYIKESGRLNHLIHFITFDICKIAVPIFIMITGALLLNKETNYKYIIKKRILRIYIAAFITIIIGIIYYNLDCWQTMSKFLLGGIIETFYWLWYVYIIIILYLLTPIIKKMITNFNEKDYKQFFICFLIIPSLIQFISNVCESCFNIPSLLGRIYNQYIFLTNIGLYVLGHYLFNLKLSKKIYKKSIIIFIISFLANLLYLIVGYINKHELINIYYNSIPVITMAASIFIISKWYSNKKIKQTLKKIFIIQSNNTLGIYLMHVFLIDYLFKTNFINNIMNTNQVLALLIVNLSIYISLNIVFWIIKKIPILKNIF